MAKHEYLGASIECEKSQIATRKISSPVLVVVIGKRGTDQHRLFKYKTTINGNAKIVEELNPKDALISDLSHLDLNDEIQGPIIEIYTSKREKCTLVSNYSNVHSIQSYDFKKFTYAKIVTPWEYILQRKTLALVTPPLAV